MRTIYRYPLRLAEVQTITGPGLGRIVAVGNSRGELEVWAEVDTHDMEMVRTVTIVGTGNEIPHGAGRHVGHVIDGPFVWHIYEGGYQ